MTELEVIRERLEKIAALAGRPIRIDGLEERVGRLEVALRLVVDRLREVPSEEPGEGTVAHAGHFSRAEVEHLKTVLGEAPP